jgi:hypothetical protein
MSVPNVAQIAPCDAYLPSTVQRQGFLAGIQLLQLANPNSTRAFHFQTTPDDIVHLTGNMMIEF